MSNRPQPVLTAASAGAVVSVLVVIAGALGVTVTDEQQTALHVTIVVLAAVLTALSHIVAGLIARRGVTPLADPVTAAGETLIPATTLPTFDTDDEVDDEQPDQIAVS